MAAQLLERELVDLLIAVVTVSMAVTPLLSFLNDKVLTPVGLISMRRESELLGLPLVDVLQTHDLVSEVDVAQAYAKLNGLRFLDLSRRPPSRAWAQTLPENIARRLKVSHPYIMGLRTPAVTMGTLR